ncbi:protein takeout-like [Eurosta solidaginis]|uniref:protein takeout-like n=1 Tax=Eurosta solidaginis TaxID=178769 RepID=UPI003531127C
MWQIIKRNFSFHKTILICGLFMVSCINEVISVEFYTEKPHFLPSPSCKLSQSDFIKCSKHTLQKLMDQLIIGIPEVTEEFGPMDPMIVKDVYYKQDSNEIATVRANLTQLTVKGFATAVIKDNKVNRKDFSWITKMFIPKMRLEGNYKMEGRLLLIPLRGSGKMFIEIENLEITFYTKTRLFEKAGFTFANVTSLRVGLNMTRVRTNFENIFNGQSKEIERSTNEFFNENWREFFEALKPVVSETVASVLFKIMHKVFILIPVKFFIEDITTSEEFYGTKTMAT